MCKPQISQAPPETEREILGKFVDVTIPDWMALRNIPKSKNVAFGVATEQ